MNRLTEGVVNRLIDGIVNKLTEGDVNRLTVGAVTQPVVEPEKGLESTSRRIVATPELTCA